MGTLKLRFEPDLDYQREAIRSVLDVFRGQEVTRGLFEVTRYDTTALGIRQTELGIGNRLRLSGEELLANVRDVQLRNGLPQSEKLHGNNFTVEMETGTGKTYVYLRTIFELHKRYGFTKFVIVVPSIAIKEGVKKSIDITTDHFRTLYNNTQLEAFVYDSKSPQRLRGFATADCIQIMIINVQAFQRDTTIMNQSIDRLDGRKPLHFVQETRPVVIIDEPQSVDSTDKGKEAIASLSPLCTLRYSATHVDKHCMLYKLDAIDAYNAGLVKQIAVASVSEEDSHNHPYIKLLKVDNKNGLKTKLELDILQRAGKVARVTKEVKAGTDLAELCKRSVYEGYMIDDIVALPGKECITFAARSEVLGLGQVLGESDPLDAKRKQIRATIDAHLQRELVLRPLGIKVLSLFFIDKVERYRQYDAQRNRIKGVYATIFEEEYARAIVQPRYATLLEGVDRETAPQAVHNGYFSIDTRKDSNNEPCFKDSRGDGDKDESAYNLIMKDKERLLDLNTPLKFIFSHSSLREGWDNPNVFQICTLNESASTLRKRQEIGRGLRLCVNQNGERVRDSHINTLTVVANESFKHFCETLQKEIADDDNIRFGLVEKHIFANIPVEIGGVVQALGQEASTLLWQHLLLNGYIDEKGKVQDALRRDLKQGTVLLPDSTEPYAADVLERLRKVAGNLNIKNANNAVTVAVNKSVFFSPEFKDLWDRIKYKTTYRVDFDPNVLVKKCAEAIRDTVYVGHLKYKVETTGVAIDRGGVYASGTSEEKSYRAEGSLQPLPDILSILQDATHLTRHSIAALLTQSGTLDSFERNPQKYIEKSLETILSQMKLCLVEGIRYQKIGSDEFYAQELFEQEELLGYLGQNMLEARKSVYEHVVYDSDVEQSFVTRFENNPAVKLYAKLPSWFTIPTPLGRYNPDWAVLAQSEDEPRLYFVVESKGNMLVEALRGAELSKIACGKKHFAALSTDVEFLGAKSFDALEERL